MKNKSYIGIAAILALIFFLGGFTIKSILNPKIRAAVNTESQKSDLNYDAEQTGQAEQSVSQTDAAKTDAVKTQDAKKEPQIIEYTVKSGDTLKYIANLYGVNVGTITQSNNILENSIIKEGQVLRFPSVNGLLYKIKGGETIWDLANTYDVNISDIVDANNMESPDKLKPGQELIIPGAKEPKPAVIANKSETKKIVQAAPVVQLSSRSSSINNSNTSQSSVSLKGIWPVRGVITSPFGMRWGKLHKGIDIGAPTGTDVHAFQAGTVVFSGWDSGGYGYLVIVDHGNGLETYYGHNSKLYVSSGQKVSAGQHISDVGSTGDATGPHCHFEIRKNGVPVNPIPYLK